MEGQPAAAAPSDFKSKKRPKQNLPSSDHILRKRQPHKPERRENIVYVSTKAPQKAWLERCTKLINKGENEIIIYCLGAAIQRGILLALRLCEEYPTFKIAPSTFTTELTDDLEPATDDADFCIQRRFNSALQIRVFRNDPVEIQK